MTSRPRNKITNLRPSFSSLKCADICAQVFISTLHREYFKRAVFGILLSQRSQLRLGRKQQLTQGHREGSKRTLDVLQTQDKTFPCSIRIYKVSRRHAEREPERSREKKKRQPKVTSERSPEHLSPEPTVEVFSLVCWDQDLIFFMLFAPIYFIYPSPFIFSSVQRLNNSEIATFSLTNNRKKDHKQKLSISSPFCLHISSVQMSSSSQETNTLLAQLHRLLRQTCALHPIRSSNEIKISVPSHYASF